MNLADVFVGLGNRWPQNTAVVSSQSRFTYRELVGRAAQTARELRSRGVTAGARVGISLRDSAEAQVGMIAIWMLGATPVPIDFRTPPAERNRLANDIELFAILDNRPAADSGFEYIHVGPDWTETLARHDTTPVWTSGDQQPSPAMISLTSGTTGRPTGVIIDHERLLLRSVFEPSQQFGTTLLNPLPLSFSASRTYTLGALLQGTTVHFHPLLFSSEELANTILTSQITSVCVVPTILRGLLEVAGERPGPLFEGLKALYTLGAPINPEEKLAARRRLCANFVDGYGASVCGRISALFGDDIESRSETVGRVLPHVTLQIVDGNDAVVPFGEPGAVRVRAPGMARGFCGGGPGGTGDVLKDGWAYPGDLGTVDESGFLRLLGRTSELIIRGGANVHPSEVEAVLAEHDGVKEVAVVGFATTREGEEIAAFVAGAAGLTEAALIALCRTRLSPDKRPRKIVFVDALPRNLNGKVSRAELRERLEREADSLLDEDRP